MSRSHQKHWPIFHVSALRQQWQINSALAYWNHVPKKMPISAALCGALLPGMAAHRLHDLNELSSLVVTAVADENYRRSRALPGTPLGNARPTDCDHPRCKCFPDITCLDGAGDAGFL